MSPYDGTADCPEKRLPSCHVIKQSPQECELLLRYSSLNKLLRVTARCQQFISKARRIQAERDSSSTVIQELTPAQLEDALQRWVSYVQRLFFKDELDSLSRGYSISAKSCLIHLSPVLDHRGVIRVGGRLRHSLLHPDEKHPMILPRESYLTKLLTWEAHMKTLHGGTQLTLNYLRQRFWILRGRQRVKATLAKCLRCWRQRSAPSTQLMGDLPHNRVRQYRPFLHSGVDYAGPIFLRQSKGRGTRSYKGYVAVFVCLASRAVHLEAASDYPTSGFLNVYRRFIARRGRCASMSSDCGRNFIGANKELRQLFDRASEQSAEIACLLADDGTEWRFNRPSAPHFGGIWEAAVKSVKSHLKRVIGETLLTFEEMTTLLTQIEACLNSRPLQPLSDDPTDLSALTPAHFLIGMPTLTVPEPSISDVAMSRLDRWQLIRQMYEHFWNRWSSEYLHELQHRPKWCTVSPQIKVGDLCLVRSKLYPPCKWPLGRIIQVYPGPDGLVRVVQIRTASSTLTRPIAKVSVLPLGENYSPVSGDGGRDVRDSSV